MKEKHFIDSHKFATFGVVLLLMYLYNQWQNTTAWIYLALHGSYGIIWVLKSRVFPDKTWERPCKLWYGLFIWMALTTYWIAPWILTSTGVQAPPWYLAMCVALYCFGVFFHFAADMQKHISLLLRPNTLITESLMARSRNINYFGELLIYLGFGLLAMHWVPVVVLALFVLCYWLPNMIRKDRSLSRYPDFETYKQRSSLFVPYLF